MFHDPGRSLRSPHNTCPLELNTIAAAHRLYRSPFTVTDRDSGYGFVFFGFVFFAFFAFFSSSSFPRSPAANVDVDVVIIATLAPATDVGDVPRDPFSRRQPPRASTRATSSTDSILLLPRPLAARPSRNARARTDRALVAHVLETRVVVELAVESANGNGIRNPRGRVALVPRATPATVGCVIRRRVDSAREVGSERERARRNDRDFGSTRNMRTGMTTATVRARASASSGSDSRRRDDAETFLNATGRMYDDDEEEDEDEEYDEDDDEERAELSNCEDESSAEYSNGDRVRFLQSGTTRSAPDFHRRRGTRAPRRARDRRWQRLRERERDDRASTRCGCASAVVSVVMLALGMSSIGRASYKEELAREREGYEEAVRRWTERERADFAAVRFEWAVPLKSSASSDVRWVETHAVSSMDDVGEFVRDVEYSPLKFALESGKDLIEAVGIPELVAKGVLDERDVASVDELLHPDASETTRSYTSGYNNTAVMEGLMGARELKLRVDGSHVLHIADVELFTKEFKPITNWKNCKYRFAGYPHSGGCDTYGVIGDVCVKLKRGRDSLWTVDESIGGGGGCEPKPMEGFDSFSWEPISRHRIVAPSTGAYPSLSVVRKTLATLRSKSAKENLPPAVSVRSSSDPRVWLLNITRATGHFAEVEARLNASGIVLIVMAIAFSIPASCLLIPLAYEKFSSFRRARQRKFVDEMAPMGRGIPLRDMV